MKMVSVYPIPSREMVSIVTPNLLMNKVEVIDMLGKVVAKYSLKGESKYSIDVNHFSEGAYHSRCNSNQVK